MFRDFQKSLREEHKEWAALPLCRCRLSGSAIKVWMTLTWLLNVFESLTLVSREINLFGHQDLVSFQSGVRSRNESFKKNKTISVDLNVVRIKSWMISMKTKMDIKDTSF